jgi:hypothetical protein
LGAIADDISASPSLAAPACSRRRLPDFLVLLPKIVVTALLALAITDVLAGVFSRYVMVEITDFLDLDLVNFRTRPITGLMSSHSGVVLIICLPELPLTLPRSAGFVR